MEAPDKISIDLNMLGSQGLNCLHIACATGNVEIVRYLLH